MRTNTPTRVIVNGAHGKMGQLACETIRQHPAFELVASLGREDDLAHEILEKKAHIVIELTRADCVFNNSLLIIEQNAHPVIGASGLLPAQIHTLQQLCKAKKLGGIIAPNFSLGAVLMMHFAGIAARFLPNVEIIEAHHPQKMDAPSGTALKTASLIAAAKEEHQTTVSTHELLPGARGAVHEGIHIHALRLPGILAHQQVIFGNQGETLTLTHNSIDRSSFMPGILLACEHVQKINTLYYGLEHLLALS